MFKNVGFAGRGAGRIPALLLAVVLGGGASCESCSKSGGGGGGTSSGGGWLVGESALMLNITHDRPDEIGNYDLKLTDDLLGIACRGTREAWVVGQNGLLISTADAGGSWTVLDPGVASALRAVALAAPNFVLVAGDGVARLSPDGGKHWRTLNLPASLTAVTFTSVALRRNDGQVALLASESGALYRYELATGAMTEVARSAGGALRSVVFARDGLTAVAVGDGGQMLVSFDGGLSFAPRATGTTASLRDVWLVGQNGEKLVAVGAEGLVLQVPARGGDVSRRSLGAGLSFRALHMQADGYGMIVGDAGAVYMTDDFGNDWHKIETGETRSIFGVDALDFGVEHL